jgi:hypothetical protein
MDEPERDTLRALKMAKEGARTMREPLLLPCCCGGYQDRGCEGCPTKPEPPCPWGPPATCKWGDYCADCFDPREGKR